MVKAPLTHDATTANVEAFLASQYIRHEIAQDIAQYREYIAWRDRWLKRLRVVLIAGALLLSVLGVFAEYMVVGGRG